MAESNPKPIGPYHAAKAPVAIVIRRVILVHVDVLAIAIPVKGIAGY